VQAASSGDSGAVEELVDAFLPAMAGVAWLYRHTPGVDRRELMQEGVVGLLSALERYDCERGTPFWAYASWFVRQAMQSLVAQTAPGMVLSDRAARQLARVKDARRGLSQARRGEPTVARLAEATGFPIEHVQSLLAADRVPRGLEEPLSADGGTATVGDAVVDPCGEDAFERVVRQIAGEELRDLPGGLTARERAIVSARYGLGCAPETLGEVARGLGVTPERVRQIEQQALAKLRAAAVVETLRAQPAAGH
jgi:RNA polymerase sigma factor (sigma-70 family)